jgi:hypothetical protein
MARKSTGIIKYRLCSALAACGLVLASLAPVSASAQDVTSGSGTVVRSLDDIARKSAPPTSVPNMSDQPDATPGRQPGMVSDELTRLGLAPIDPTRLPKLADARGDAPPEPDSGIGATLLAAAAFVLLVYVLGRVLR